MALLDDSFPIDANRLLIEAQPIGERLDQSTHGFEQVSDRLETDEFEANLGMTTDSLRWLFMEYDGTPIP